MAEAWGGVGAHGDALCVLFLKLGVLDDGLDGFFLGSSLVIAAPPHGSFVFTFQPEMVAGATCGFSLIALLPSETTCEATCG